MSHETVEFVTGILLVSPNPARLAAFYRDILSLPLEEERHDELDVHYGCDLGDLHFAIHPIGNFKDERHGVGSIKLAFQVFDIDAFVRRLAAHGVTPLFPLENMGFGLMTAVLDPDGNYVELTQLADGWFEYLAERKSKGIDVVQRWKSVRQPALSPAEAGL